MAVKNKTRYISLAVQEAALRRCFPLGKITRVKEDSLKWEGYLHPTAFSSYKVQIVYKPGRIGKKVKVSESSTLSVYVIEPKILKLPEGKSRLRHVYDNKRQRLCLYYGDDWNRSMLIADTVIWWASEWLFFYEIWLETGKWKGGGTHPKKEDYN